MWVVINGLDGAEEYELDKDLFSQIIPDSSRCDVLRTKIEVVMKKADNLQWATLEPSATVACPSYANPSENQMPHSAAVFCWCRCISLLSVCRIVRQSRIGRN